MPLNKFIQYINQYLSLFLVPVIGLYMRPYKGGSRTPDSRPFLAFCSRLPHIFSQQFPTPENFSKLPMENLKIVYFLHYKLNLHCNTYRVNQINVYMVNYERFCPYLYQMQLLGRLGAIKLQTKTLYRQYNHAISVQDIQNRYRIKTCFQIQVKIADMP